jgi:saccharopine dehydrogenase-like NADP-dependent oxidoreductase
MKVLLLGVGMQGKAALHDLVLSPAVSQVVAADRAHDALGAHVVRSSYAHKVHRECVGAEDSESCGSTERAGT